MMILIIVIAIDFDNDGCDDKSRNKIEVKYPILLCFSLQSTSCLCYLIILLFPCLVEKKDGGHNVIKVKIYVNGSVRDVMQINK